MEFRVLGPVGVAADQQTTVLDRGLRRTILAVLLAAHGRTVPTVELVTSVWAGDPPATARKSLQSHLSRLRTQLADLSGTAPHPLVSEADGYRVDLTTHTLDAHRFTSLVDRARACLPSDPEQAAALLSDALALWRGPAFGDLADHPGLRAEAVHLEQVRRAATADHVDARLALGHHEQLVGELERAVRDDPLEERHHGQLMVALYGSGRQADALATYRQLHDGLREELGVDPSPAVRDLHERILRQDPTLAPAVGPTGPASAPPPTADRGRPSMPRPTADLVGRDEAVADLAAWVAPGTLVTLTGPGGVGKTRLAEQVVARVADRFDDGVAVGALAPVRHAGGVGDALVTALGIQPTGDHSTADTLVVALGERHLLLLLDNCEHVLAAVTPLVDAIRGRCPNVAILATSRERLHLAGERLWPVAPLDVPSPGDGPDAIARTPAGALFRLRTRAAEADFELSDTNAPAVAELCRRLDGMPLAIELAAARVRALGATALVDRLDQRFDLLAGGPRHEGGRHRTLQAVVAWSYELLEPPEARLFDRLSVFAGTFPLEAAEQVCAGGAIRATEVAGLLGELVDKSMVVAERRREAVGYRLLDTLREFGSRRLAEVDDPDTWRRAHADHHVALAERLGPEVRGPGEATAVAGIDAAFDDLRAAHAWLVEAGDVDGALRLPAALADYAFYRLRDEVTTWARRAVALPGAADHPAHAAPLATAAYGATTRDECRRAHREASEALARADRDGMSLVWARGALGVAALYEGRLDDLLVHADHLTAAADHLDCPFYVAFAGVLRTIGHTYRGEADAVVDAQRGLDAAAEASGSPTMRAFARYCHGEAHLEVRPAEAATALEEAVRLAREVDNALIEGVSMVSLASLRGRLGETDEALRQFREVVVHWRRLGDHTHQLTTLRNLVVLLAQIGADEPAAHLHGAVTAGLTPSFGLEEQRLAAAWEAVADRLGAAAAAEAAGRGSRLTATQMGQAALDHIDALLAG